MIGPVHQFKLSDIQPHLNGLAKALKGASGPTHTVGDVLRLVAREQAQLWLSDGALIITEVCDEPLARVLNVWVATGELDPVLELSDRVEEWARENGCKYMTLVGRRGWLPVLRSRGWQNPQLLLEKELT